MKNRNLVYKRINQLESTLVNLKRIVSTQEPIEVYKTDIGKVMDLLDKIKDLVETQPLDASEINPIR